MQKDPALACLLNLIIPGVGHVYLGLVGKGIFLMALAVLLGIFLYGIGYILVMIWTMFDAYNIAKKMNRHVKKTTADKG